MAARDCYWENMAMSVFVLSLLKGVDPHRALGYTSLPIIGDLLQVLLDDDIELEGNASTLLKTWLLFHGANFYTLGLKQEVAGNTRGSHCRRPYTRNRLSRLAICHLGFF